MKKKLLVGFAMGMLLVGTFSISLAAPVTPEDFSAGLNTGYSVTGISSVDGNVDWFIFDSNGIDQVSFWFDRTVAAPDLIAGLYSGDTSGFDYAAAGATSSYSYSQAAAYNTNLTFISYFDDTHNDTLGGPFGDPDFNLSLAAGRYSLALSSLYNGGTYQFRTNVDSAYHANPVPEPATMLLFGAGLAGLIGLRRRQGRK